MRRSAVVFAAVLAVGGTLLHSQPPPQAPQIPPFRTGIDVVFVDVVVRDGGRIVTGLRAEDFVVTDNGIRQRVESADATSVPIDLTVIVDVSGNPHVAMQERTSPSRKIQEIEREVHEIGKALGPEDRVRLLAIDRHVHQVLPWRAASSHESITGLEHDGLPALYDTLAAALMHTTEPARRHVVIARTRGRDSISSVDARAVRGLAERSDALLHLAVMERELDAEATMTSFQCQLMGLCWPTRNFWVPYRRALIGPRPKLEILPDGQSLAAGAEATGGGVYQAPGLAVEAPAPGPDETGGRVHQASGISVPTLTGLFKKTMDDFRGGYVLRYTPEGVTRAGWHAIEVTVPASRSFTVRARRGYFIEPDAAAPGRPAPSGPPRTLDELAAAYDRHDYTQVATAVRTLSDPLKLLREFAQAGNPWPATPRREAAFALDLVEPAVFSSLPATREAARALLDRFGRLIRHPLEADDFERYWHFAALTMLEGAIRPRITEAFAQRALDRFPDEPRFLLSHAIAVDQRWAGQSRAMTDEARGKATRNIPRLDELVTGEHAGTVRHLYEGAMAHSETAAEARIRLAWLLHRVGEHGEAVTHLTHRAAEAVADPSLAYLRRLFLGHALQGMRRHDESVTAYREALALVPHAQSARVALMNALVIRGDRAEAEALADEIQGSTGNEVDPWWIYWQGQYRFHQHAMARLRELSR